MGEENSQKSIASFHFWYLFSSTICLCRLSQSPALSLTFERTNLKKTNLIYNILRNDSSNQSLILPSDVKQFHDFSISFQHNITFCLKKQEQELSDIIQNQISQVNLKKKQKTFILNNKVFLIYRTKRQQCTFKQTKKDLHVNYKIKLISIIT